MRKVETVKSFCFGCFIRKIEYLWNAFLHFKCQFIGCHACSHDRISRILKLAKSVELLRKIDSQRLRFTRKTPFGLCKVEWIVGIYTQWHSIVRRTKIVPVSSETTMAMASVCSLMPNAARWRVPS